MALTYLDLLKSINQQKFSTIEENTYRHDENNTETRPFEIGCFDPDWCSTVPRILRWLAVCDSVEMLQIWFVAH